MDVASGVVGKEEAGEGGTKLGSGDTSSYKAGYCQIVGREATPGGQEMPRRAFYVQNDDVQAQFPRQWTTINQ